MANNNNRTALIIGGVVLGTTVIIVAYFGILKPILNKLGITDDAADRKAQKLEGEAAFGSQLARKYPQRVTMSESKANNLAYQIYMAKGYVYDNEDEAIGAIRECGTTYNLSYLAGRFQSVYGKDLLGYLKTFLSSDHLSTVYDAIKNYNY